MNNEYVQHTFWFLRRLALLTAATVLLASLGACSYTPHKDDFAYVPAANPTVTPGIEAF